MDALSTAKQTAEAVFGIPTGFMMDGATYERGGQMGFEGIDFYFLGRGGVLGEVPADVVAAALVFFEPSTVAAAWDRGRQVCGPAQAARAFAECAASWAEAHLPDGVDYERLADLERRVIASASVAGAPLFAGWRALAEPSSPRALALHRTNVLRELRGALHGGAVLAAGLSPLEAVMVKTPFMVGLFGWSEPHPDPTVHKEAWEQAEEGTDRAMARRFAVLAEAERDELVALLSASRPR
ncbi:MAG TPA: hypothetical protein VK386_03270 [Acidimicrobiales bacterium]|nr:hypothetical protein [Acidimicrobiales bacterium]